MKKLLLFATLFLGLSTFMSAQYNLPAGTYRGNTPKIKPVLNPRIQIKTVDPALISLTKTGRNANRRHHGRVLVRLKNLGTMHYTSGRNQQSVQLYRNGRFVRSFPFVNLRAGQVLNFAHNYVEPIYTGEFVAKDKWEVRIAYDPDIYNDGNTNNDDRNRRNNYLRRLVGQ